MLIYVFNLYFMIYFNKMHENILFIFYCAYTQDFVIIKKRKIIDHEINFDNSKILSKNITNPVFQGWM